MDQEGGTTRHLLTQAGANLTQLRSQLGELLDRLPHVQDTGGEIQISRDLGRALNLTDKFAQKRGDQFISSELFLLAAIEGTRDLGNVLTDSGITPERLEKAIDSIRGGHKVDDSKYGRAPSGAGEIQQLISQKGRSRADSTPSSVVMRKFVERSRYCNAGQKTTQC